MSKKVDNKISRKRRNEIKLYLKVNMRLRGTNMTDVSRDMGHNKSYVNTSIDTLNVNPLTKVLKKIASFMNVSAVNVLSILYGNQKLLDKTKHTCAVKVGIPYIKKRISTDELKKKLSAQEYHDIMEVANPSIDELEKLSDVMRVSPVALGSHFGRSMSEVKQLRKGNVNPINKRLIQLRHKAGLSQVEVAKSLHIYQTAVSGFEKRHIPRPITIFKLAHLYHAAPLALLKYLPQYRGLQQNSPAYRLMQLCDKENTSSNGISKKAGLPSYIAINVLSHRQHNRDRMLDVAAKKITRAYHLPSDYFGKTESKNEHRLNNYKRKAKQEGISKKDFGYKVFTTMISHGLTLRSFADKFNMYFYNHIRDNNHKMGVTYQAIQLMKHSKLPRTHREKQVKKFMKTLN